MEIHEKDMKKVFNGLKASALKRNIFFDLTMMQLYDISIPITCPILGISLIFHRGKPQDNSVSFDRIDSAQGYTYSNLHVISMRANKLKSNATKKELKQISDYF